MYIVLRSPMTEINEKEIEKTWLKRIRAFIGVLGMILPWIALVGASIVAKAKPEAIARFKAAIERKRQIAAELEKEMTEEYEKQTGKKVKSFFVL